MNTVDGSPFSKNVFLNNVSKKLLPLVNQSGLVDVPGVPLHVACVGKYGLAVEAFAVTHCMFN